MSSAPAQAQRFDGQPEFPSDDPEAEDPKADPSPSEPTPKKETDDRPEPDSGKSPGEDEPKPRPTDPTAGKTRVDPGPPPVERVARDRRKEPGRSNRRRPPRDRTTSAPPTSASTVELSNFRSTILIGGHLTIAEQQLADAANRIGGGLDLTVAGAPQDWPVLFGFQTGFDAFGGPSETFTYRGVTATHSLQTTGFWFHGLVRLQPVLGRFRPYVDLLGGLWALSAGIDTQGRSDNSFEPIGSGVAGSYGLGAGVHWVFEGGLTLGLGGVYMRGSSMTIPNLNDTVVVDDVLFFGSTKLEPPSQGMILLSIGFSGD